MEHTFLQTLILAVLASGAFSTIVTAAINHFERKRDKDDAIQLLLYHDTKQECLTYIEQGSIDSDSLEVLIKMHETYHKRGGNGYLDKLMAEVKKLPISA